MTLVHGYLVTAANDFQATYRSGSVFREENRSTMNLINGSSSDDSSFEDGTSQSEGWSPSSEGEHPEEKNHADSILKFINEMLMEEEDLSNKPYMLHDSLALQATEKSLYDCLTNNDPPQTTATTSSEINTFLQSSWSENLRDLQCHLPPLDALTAPVNQSSSNRRKHRCREGEDEIDCQRSNKQLANNGDESDPLELMENLTICSEACNPTKSDAVQNEGKKKSPQARVPGRGRPKGGKKQRIVKEVVDLRNLLMQCAQAVATYDSRTVNDLLAKIRQHSSPHGDGMERLAHYIAKALESRLAGTGTASYIAFSNTRISAAQILRAYQTFIKACPFKIMSSFYANRTILKMSNSAHTLHIIDFGILYGFQWPCLIQALSERPGGLPMLRLTGIDFPQPGFRPAERVADTGRRLARHCERFGVQFEYIAIAQKWETIKLEDLKINKGEMVVVNSLYRLQNVPDETVVASSPRDAVLGLIKTINPDLFIHGVANGTYNTPFFVTRFREAMFYYSSLFDMFEATMTRDDPNRLLFEEEVFGKDATNIIACEGTERVDRPETYKQWQVRNVRAGLKQVPLDEGIMRYVRNKVKRDYHKDFSVDEDGKWMLHGWKGRVIHAVSCWKPAHS